MESIVSDLIITPNFKVRMVILWVWMNLWVKWHEGVIQRQENVKKRSGVGCSAASAGTVVVSLCTVPVKKSTRLWTARLSSYILPKCVRVLLCWVSSVSILPLGHLLTSLCFNLCKLLRPSFFFLISFYTCLYSRYATWNYMLCHWRDPSRLILSLIHLISHKVANYTNNIVWLDLCYGCIANNSNI